MMRASRIWLIAAVFGLSVSAPLRAQGPTTGALSGTVRDALGGAVADARITLGASDGSAARTALTTGAGEFRFALVPPGEYRLGVEKEGYAPQHSTFSVRTGAEVRVDLALPAEGDSREGPAEGLVARATLLGRPGGALLPLPELALGLPLGPRAELHELAGLIAALDESLGAEGLPGAFSTLLIDGTPFRPAAHPLARRGPLHSTAFPLAAFRTADLALNGLDVEWPGAAGAVLGAQTWTGTSGNEVEARLRWSGDALPGASSFSAEAPSFNDLRLGLLLRRPLDAGRGRLALGGQASREQAPHARAWPATEAARSLAAAAAEAGVALEDPTRAQTARADRVALFGRLDWQSAPRHRLEAGAHLVSLPHAAVPTGAPLAPTGGGPLLEGLDLVAGAALHSAFGDQLANLARVGVTHSARRAGDTDPVAPTFLVQEGLGFGSAARVGQSRETFLHLRNTIQHHAGAHTLSVGAALTLGAYRYEHREQAGGTFFFGSTELLRARQGVSLRTEGLAPVTDWSAPGGAWYAQDHWRVRPGFELLVGALLERSALTERGVPRDLEWFRLTGIANDVVEPAGWRLSPRVGATWDVHGDGRWTLDLAAGTYHDRADPLLLAQWQHDAGGVRVRRVVGEVAWPEPGGGGSPLRRLTVLAPRFDAPRTARVTAGLAHRLGTGTVVDVRVVSRRTASLPRRSDLNRLLLPTAHDQYERPLYGTLAKQAALLTALPGTGRRFDGYDEVVGVATDGWSEHRGVSLGLEHETGRDLSLMARYSFGRTRDNWFGGDWAVAPPAGFESDAWVGGRSDFDVPHRLALGAVFEPTPGLQVATFYRYASGRPFTPGFRAGVDANGDGTFGNDPAFVDAALPGMAALLQRWPCLRAAAGRFAPRNACRADGTHTANLRADWSGARFGGASATLTLEAFNLFGAARTVPDAALLLLDPAAGLVFDPDSRSMTVPLVVNPGFGRPLDNPQPGRLLRLGLSLRW